MTQEKLNHINQNREVYGMKELCMTTAHTVNDCLYLDFILLCNSMMGREFFINDGSVIAYK